MLQAIFDGGASSWFHYPANRLRAKIYGAKSRLGLVSQAERRQELVGPSHLWKMKRDFQIRFLRNAGMVPQHHVLDFGCGVLRGGLPLIEYLEPGHYCGIESRAAALDEGKRALQEAGLQAKAPTLLVVEDVSAATIQKQFDFIWAFSVLIHMEDKILGGYLNFVSRHLAPQGRMYGNVILGDGSKKDGKWQQFPVVSRRRAFYESTAEHHGLRMTEIGTLQSLGHVSGSPGQDLQMMMEFVRR